MNKDYVLCNLDEAHRALGEIIAELRSNRDYDYGEYVVDMTHVYHPPEHRLERARCDKGCCRRML
jgi:hypothetical protein